MSAVVVLFGAAVVLGQAPPWERPTYRPLDTHRTLAVIAFGTCAKEARPQPIWDTILAQAPDVFLFGGDNIYGDSSDADILRRKYGQLAAQPGFQRLIATTPVLATWDDHDFGVNDGGADHAGRDIAQAVFCEFFGISETRGPRQHPGVYDSVVVGPPGRRVQIVLLDTRYFRSPLARGERNGLHPDGYPGRYVADRSAGVTLLGDAQWAWLEDQLRVPAELRLVVSSIQLVSEDHGLEKWMNLPAERERLCALIAATGANGIVVLSGDRHKAELSRLDGCAGYPLYDLTSSALNQQAIWFNEINRHRIGSEYREENFAMVRIDWEAPDPVVRLEVRDLLGTVVIERTIRLSELRHPRGDDRSPDEPRAAKE